MKNNKKGKVFEQTAGAEQLFLHLALTKKVTLQQVQSFLGVEERRARSGLKALRALLGGDQSIVYDRLGKQFRLSSATDTLDRVAAVLKERFRLGERLLSGLVDDPRVEKAVKQGGIAAGVRGDFGLRTVSVKDILAVLSAVASGDAVEPEQRCWGWDGPVTPSLILDLGRYWAIRGYCHEGGKWVFRPLVGTLDLRLSSSGEDRSQAKKSRDTDWAEMISVSIAPHPRLGGARSDVVLDGLQMQHVCRQFFGKVPAPGDAHYDKRLERRFHVRRALLPFFLDQWAVDTTAKGTDDPAVYPLWLANRQTVALKAPEAIRRRTKAGRSCQ